MSGSNGTRSARGSGDLDDEVSFSDPLSLEGFKLDNETQSRLFNGFSNNSKPGPLSSKRKRKSCAEKFLEDNSDYYGIEVISILFLLLSKCLSIDFVTSNSLPL